MKPTIHHLLPITLSLWMIISGGCGSEGEDTDRVVTLRVGVAASLGPWMEEFAQAYEREHPGVRFEISAGGSNVITRQALSGAPLDIIILASSELMQRIDSAGRLLPGTRRVIGTNRLCLIIPERGFVPDDLEDLASADIERIAIGSPGVPAGDYAREVLDRLQLTPRLTDRFVFGANVRQVLAWVETGDAASKVLPSNRPKRRSRSPGCATTDTGQPYTYSTRSRVSTAHGVPAAATRPSRSSTSWSA